MIYNIALIGAGELGSRHLQSLKKGSLDSNLYVVDLNEDSLDLARKRYEQIPDNEHIQSIKFSTELSSLPERVDLLVLATGSNKRAILLKTILSACIVKNMILEKVLFQDIDSYGEIASLLKDQNVNAWVNCTRREQEGYKQLKTRLSDGPIYAMVDGSNWGLGCNSIHFIDIMSYLSGCDEYSISTNDLDPDVLNSKRQGYIEMTGMLKIYFSDHSVLLLSSRKESGTPASFTISTPALHCIINESQNTILEKTATAGYVQSDFKLSYQSDLTHLVAQDILLHGDCNLATYEQSMKLHLPFIKAVLEFLNRQGMNVENCPIT